MTIGLIVLIAFVALVLACGLFLALVDRAPEGFEDSGGYHDGIPGPGSDWRDWND